MPLGNPLLYDTNCPGLAPKGQQYASPGQSETASAVERRPGTLIQSVVLALKGRNKRVLTVAPETKPPGQGVPRSKVLTGQPLSPDYSPQRHREHRENQARKRGSSGGSARVLNSERRSIKRQKNRFLLCLAGCLIPPVYWEFPLLCPEQRRGTGTPPEVVIDRVRWLRGLKPDDPENTCGK